MSGYDLLSKLLLCLHKGYVRQKYYFWSKLPCERANCFIELLEAPRIISISRVQMLNPSSQLNYSLNWWWPDQLQAGSSNSGLNHLAVRMKKKKNHYCDSCISEIAHSMDSLCLLSVTEYKGKAIVEVSLGFEFQTIKNVGSISHVGSVRLGRTGYMWNLHPKLSALDLLIPHWGITAVHEPRLKIVVRGDFCLR